MAYLFLILLTVIQFCTGWAILNLLAVKFKAVQAFCLSILLGLFVISAIPYLLAFLTLPINLFWFCVIAIFICSLLNYRGRFYMNEFKSYMPKKLELPKLYDLVFFTVFAYLLFISLWRCVYLPPFARDMLVGAELLAKYAVEESRFVSSVFLNDIEISSNNPFKTPYILCQQIIYKLIGFPFGKIWLAFTSLSFTIFLYSLIKEKLNAFLAGVLMLFFLTIPEIYAYSFVMMYDYSNMVFYALSVLCLCYYISSKQKGLLILSGILLSAATFVRAETLIFAIIGLSIIAFEFREEGVKSMATNCCIYFCPSLVLYLSWFNLFMPFYLPKQYDIAAQVSYSLFDVEHLIQTFKDINAQLIFSAKAVSYYGYFAILFALTFLLDLFVFRSRMIYFSFWIVMTYLTYVLLTHMLGLVEIENTVKRGFFKLFPLMLFYMLFSPLWQYLSEKLTVWEEGNA